MADVFIYGGLGIMCLASLYGIIVAIRGLKEMKANTPRRIFNVDFSYSDKSPALRRRIRWFLIGEFAGMTITAIGIAIGLN